MSTSEKGRPPSVYPLLSGAYVPPCLKTWHGCSLSFTSAIPAFYADNSFQKTTKLQQKLTDARLALIKKHLIAKARVERVKVQQEQQAVARSLRAQQRRFERELRASSTARHNAATKIQKVVRGWLCRRDTERRLIASERERALKEVQSLEDFAHWWYLTSEREIAQRAQVIQRAFRRYRRLKMLAVVAKAPLPATVPSWPLPPPSAVRPASAPVGVEAAAHIRDLAGAGAVRPLADSVMHTQYELNAH